VDYGTYRTETWEHGSVQVALTRAAAETDAEPPARATEEGATFGALPPGHPDEGQPVAAWYFWLFPNLMLNFYPWGLSLNVVEPRGPAATRIRFESWVHRPELRAAGAGAELHRVELEDEAVVEATQRGMRSRLYRRGRFSPAREAGVHHFHRLLAAELAAAGWPAPAGDTRAP
jgi:choline monooxygenase